MKGLLIILIITFAENNILLKKLMLFLGVL